MAKGVQLNIRKTSSDVLPVATAVTIDYSLLQEYEESPILDKHEVFLAHFSPEEKGNNVALFLEYQGLFSDVPTQTNVLEHDIDIGDSARSSNMPIE
jgi:hypothetical protein